MLKRNDFIRRQVIRLAAFVMKRRIKYNRVPYSVSYIIFSYSSTGIDFENQ